MHLSKDELFLVANKLDLLSILNLSACNKKLYNRMNMNDIWNNKLREFPDFEFLNIEKSKKEIYIVLHNVQNFKNRFNFEDNIYELYNSKSLDLNACNLTKIPKEILFLNNLENIFLSRNIIRDITPLTKLYNIKSLYLHHNLIREIPKEISDMVNLTKLEISHNLIEKIPIELCNMKKLERLDLTYNSIKTVPEELYNLKKSTFLSLRL